MKKSDKFWDKKAESYAKKPVPDEQRYQQKLTETQAFLNPDMQLLEFGCGTGSTAIQHAPLVRHIHAVDISENMLAIGRTKAKQAGIDNISFSCGTLQDCNAADESVDAVLGLNVIHLVEDRQTLIAEVARVLKPGGIFVSSTGCLGNSYFRFLRWLVPILKPLGIIPGIYVFSEQELAADISAAGFAIERQWHYGPQNIDVFIIARKC